MYCVPQILVSIGDVEDDAHVNGGEVGLISFQNFTFIGHSRETGRDWTEGFFHFLHQIGNRGVIWSVDDFFPESRHHDYCASARIFFDCLVFSPAQRHCRYHI